MAKINRRVAGLILLAALDFKSGDKLAARKNLQLASDDENFEETLEGLNDVTDTETDPFLEEGSDDEDEAGEGLEGLDDLIGPDDLEETDEDKEESASLAKAAKKTKAVAAEENIEDGDSKADPENDNSNEDNSGQMRQVARLKKVRANLQALASVK